MIQTIVHWGEGKPIVVSKPPAPTKKNESVDSEGTSKKRKRRQEANEDRALIKKDQIWPRRGLKE